MCIGILKKESISLHTLLKQCVSLDAHSLQMCVPIAPILIFVFPAPSEVFATPMEMPELEGGSKNSELEGHSNKSELDMLNAEKPSGNDVPQQSRPKYSSAPNSDWQRYQQSLPSTLLTSLTGAVAQPAGEPLSAAAGREPKMEAPPSELIRPSSRVVESTEAALARARNILAKRKPPSAEKIADELAGMSASP